MPLLAWMLNCAYLLVLAIASPVLAWRALRQGKYRSGFGEKVLGALPEFDDRDKVAWFHAVSVGEVLQLETIVPDFAARHPDRRILITTTTNTGLDIARERFGHHTCCYFPLDFSWAVSRAMRRVKPDLVVLVELELWPNFIFAARRCGAKLTMINGRMSERSYRGYGRIGWLVRPVLRCFDSVGAQTRDYAERLENLGAIAVQITGSIKFDRVQTDRHNNATAVMRDAFSIHDDHLVLVAGSTQAPEELMALRAWQELRTEFPMLRLILVPRHKERFDEVVELVESLGELCARRTSMPASCADDTVVVLDTLGELGDCWGLADVAFVGGSFGDRGGQNMIEPAAYGSAVLIGPNTVNFRDTVDRLLAADAAIVVSTGDDFGSEVRSLLLDPENRRAIGQRAQDVVREQAGGSQRTLELLDLVLRRTDKDEPVRHHAA